MYGVVMTARTLLIYAYRTDATDIQGVGIYTGSNYRTDATDIRLKDGRY